MVQVIIPPVEKMDGFEATFDFTTPAKILHDLDHLEKHWDLHMRNDGHDIGRACFAAYQFLADGVPRRTITLKFIELNPKFRGQKKSYEIGQFVIDTVTEVCDREWGAITAPPVIFVERRHLDDLEEHEKAGAFNFLKKVAEKLIGHEHKPQPVSDQEVITAVGSDVSMQLIHGHLARSNQAEHGDPSHDHDER